MFKSHCFLKLLVVSLILMPRFTVANGGSNYPWYDIGNGTADSTIRPVIGTYHLAPDVVKQQLLSLYKNGQREITLFLWYKPFSPKAGGPISDVWTITCNSAGGKLSAQAQSNLVNILSLVKQTGFTKLHFRFAGQGSANPNTWTSWNEAKFQENLAFIKSTRAIVEEHRNGIPVMYDLGAELAGRPKNPQALRYCRELWKAYTSAFGPSDSYAFSFIASDTYLDNFITDMKASGLPLPPAYAFDMYKRHYEMFTRIFVVLRKHNEQGKRIILQECFYNDLQTATDVKKAMQQLGFKLESVFQWPHTKGLTGWRNAPTYTPLFNNYINL
jgi:hypothetical protein